MSKFSLKKVILELKNLLFITQVGVLKHFFCFLKQHVFVFVTRREMA